jgi:serine/threonine protein kinase
MTLSSLEEWKGVFAQGDLVAKRYRILRLIGAGGSGEVYAVEDVALGEQLALKTLSPGMAQSPVGLERFRREVSLSRRVTHPNVCRIFDLAEHEGADGRWTFFFTMELLDGTSLAHRLQHGARMTTAEAFPLIAQIAAGLQAAHDSGVVHRDLKPANIMLSGEQGARVVITDFGLARNQDLDAVTLTESGEMLGTAFYMSPEQVQGADITPASDIYALGIVMYEMLTLGLPFEDVNQLATALRRLRLPPTPIHSRAPDLPARWVAAIDRCLSLDPADRFARALDVTAALEEQSPSPAEPSRPGWLASLLNKTLGKRQP